MLVVGAMPQSVPELCNRDKKDASSRRFAETAGRQACVSCIGLGRVWTLRRRRRQDCSWSVDGKKRRENGAIKVTAHQTKDA